MARDAENLRVKAEVAWLYALKGDHARGKSELEALLEPMVDKTIAKDILAQTRYRLGMCVWNLDDSNLIVQI